LTLCRAQTQTAQKQKTYETSNPKTNLNPVHHSTKNELPVMDNQWQKNATPLGRPLNLQKRAEKPINFQLLIRRFSAQTVPFISLL
jgi:hypothetical protein